MGVFDKFKKILFDEEIEEVTTQEELPERTPKKNLRSESGFIDYSAQKDDEDEIKEVVYSPRVEEESSKPVSRTSRYGSEEYERKEDAPRQISRYEDSKPYVEPEKKVEEPKVEEAKETKEISIDEYLEREHKYDFGSDFDKPEVKEEHTAKREEPSEPIDKYGLRRDYKAILRNESEVRHGELEHKDYAAIVKDKHEAVPGKKPFVVTPVISPVYGILDKNYTPDSVIEKNKDNSDLDKQKRRLMGKPEEIVLTKETIEVKTKPIEEEYMDSIKNIIDEDVNVEDNTIEDQIEDTAEYEISKPTIEYEEPKIEEAVEEDIPIEEDYITPPKEETPKTEEYYEEPEVEEEDDFEAPSVSIDTLIDNPMEDEDETPKAELDDTIETDLFNLIDSMYSKDDEGE